MLRGDHTGGPYGLPSVRIYVELEFVTVKEGVDKIA